MFILYQFRLIRFGKSFSHKHFHRGISRHFIKDRSEFKVIPMIIPPPVSVTDSRKLWGCLMEGMDKVNLAMNWTHFKSWWEKWHFYGYCMFSSNWMEILHASKFMNILCTRKAFRNAIGSCSIPVELLFNFWDITYFLLSIYDT